MDDYIELKIDVFDITGQRARVRKSISVATLIDEVLLEFDDLDRRLPESYGLFLRGQDRPLDRTRTLDELDIQNYDELEFKYAKAGVRGKLHGAVEAVLRDESTGMVYPITWQPALIGRPDADPSHNELLAVNLASHPEGRRISRRHAEILLEGGLYYIESLSENNPTYLNNQQVTGRRLLQSGDKIGLGRTTLTLVFYMNNPG